MAKPPSVAVLSAIGLKKNMHMYLVRLGLKLPYSKACVEWPLSKKGPKIGFQDQLSLNAGQKYCRMLQGEHSAILSTFIKLPLVIKIFLSIFKRPFYTGFSVLCFCEE